MPWWESRFGGTFRLAAVLVHERQKHDMPMFAIAGRSGMRQRREFGAADNKLEPVIVQAGAQAMAEQPQWHELQKLTQRKAYAGGDCAGR